MNILKKMLLVTAFAAAFGVTTGAHASLIGNTITATGTSVSPGTAVIGSGIEFSGIFDYINFDFGASTLTLTSPISGVSWSGFGDYVFSGFTDVITGLTIASNKGFSGDVITDFSFGAHSITLNMDAGRAQNKNAELVFNIATAPTNVPEPGTVAMFGLGMLSLVASRRKPAKSA